MEKVLSIENLTIGYKDKDLVKSINCSLNKNEFIIVLGKNGIGKSTLIHSILGFQSYNQGKIYLENEDLKSFSATEIAQKIAVVFSKLNQVPQIKVIDLIKTGRIPYHQYLEQSTKEENDLIENIIDLVGISSLKNQFASELSEGQLQLVMIARALVQDTPILILDEPTANLDLENQIRIFKLIKKLKEETKKTILMITHEADLALSFADKIWWIENQQLIEDSPEDLAFNHQIISKLSGQFLQFDDNQMNYSFSTNQNVNKLKNQNSEYVYWLNKGIERLNLKLSENLLESIAITEKNIIFDDLKFETIYSFLNHIKQYEKYNNNRSE